MSENIRPFKIQFPVSYDLKVIMERLLSDEEHRQLLENILENLSIPFSDWSHKYSKEAKYISITVRITLQNRERMDSLYDELRKQTCIRVAI